MFVNVFGCVSVCVWGGGGRAREGGGRLSVGDLLAVSMRAARVHCITWSACGRNKGFPP